MTADPDPIAKAEAALALINHTAIDAPLVVARATAGLDNRSAHAVLIRWLAQRQIRGRGSWRELELAVWAARRELLRGRRARERTVPRSA